MHVRKMVCVKIRVWKMRVKKFMSRSIEICTGGLLLFMFLIFTKARRYGRGHRNYFLTELTKTLSVFSWSELKANY